MQSYLPFGGKNLSAPGNNRDFRDVTPKSGEPWWWAESEGSYMKPVEYDPIVGTWQHRVSPGVVPVIVGDQFDQDDSDEEFDTPIVVINEDVGGES